MSQQPSLTPWAARGREILPAHDPIPKVMGIVNLTPDSFSDGGSTQHPEAALAHARRLVAEGADYSTWGANRAGRGPSRFHSPKSCAGLFRSSRRSWVR